VVSLTVFAVVTLLLLGWRYDRSLPRWGTFAIGGLGGTFGGAAGLGGPPVILLYLASSRAVARIRANFLLYLLGIDLLMLANLAALGRLDLSAAGIGLTLVLPYMGANWLGGRMFLPGRERLYRAVAYAVITCAAVMGLPVWG
ncbi:MAG: sulfite exporter TauE/SafE family protein, partial [Pseudomonadota bacterium]